MGLMASVVGAKGARDAAKVGAASAEAAGALQAQVARESTAEQRRQYDQTRADFAPYRAIGAGGINNLARVSGIGMPGTFDAGLYRNSNPDLAAAGYDDAGLQQHWDRYGRFEGRASPMVGATTGGASDMSPFFTSPDYNFRRSEGQRDIGNSFAARGGAFSGNALKALSEFNSNLASGEFGNWWNRQAGLVDAGQGGTAQTASAGANTANAITGINQNAAGNIGNSMMQAGNARASGIQGATNAFQQGSANTANALGFFFGGGFGGKGFGGR
jgi:hypothetical protein